MALHVAMQDLGLKQAFIVYPGSRSYRVADKVEAVPLPVLRERLQTGRGR